MNLSCSEVLTAIVKEVVDLVEDILAENRCMCVDGYIVNSCCYVWSDCSQRHQESCRGKCAIGCNATGSNAGVSVHG